MADLKLKILPVNYDTVKNQLEALERDYKARLHIDVDKKRLEGVAGQLKSIAASVETVEKAVRGLNSAFSSLGGGGAAKEVSTYGAAFDALGGQIKNLQQQKKVLNKLLKDDNSILDSDARKDAEAYVKSIDAVLKSGKQMRKQFADINDSTEFTHAAEFNQQMDAMGKTAKGSAVLIDEFNEMAASAKDSSKTVENAYNKVLDARRKIITEQSNYNQLFTGRNKDRVVQTEIDNQQLAQLAQYADAFENYRSKIKAGKSMTDDDWAGFRRDQEQATQLIKEVQLSRAEIDKALRSTKNSDMELTAFDKIGSRLTDYYTRYETQLTKNINLYNKWLNLMSKANSGSFASVADANREFAAFRTEARSAGVEIESFGSKLEQTFGTRVRSALSGYGVFAMEGAVRDVLQNVLSVDTALTELKKVTDETDSVYGQFMDNASVRAQKLGATLSEVVNATADYARLGYDINQATPLADSALIYRNVGDDVASIDDATASLISTMQGFGISAENSMTIVDKFNHVSNRYASSAGK